MILTHNEREHWIRMRQLRADKGTERLLRRTILGGYHRRDVVLVVEGLREQLGDMAESLERSWQERERLVQEFAEERSALTRELERERDARAEREARGRAEASRLLAEAEEQAARIRHEAAKRVGEATSRFEDILQLREQLLGEVRGLVDGYGSLLERAEHQRFPATPESGEVLAHGLALSVAQRDGGLFARRVELDVGPFADFAELSAFERSLARLPKVEDVHIRRFGEERAEIELTLSEETQLVSDLTSNLPYRVDVKPEDERHVIVDVLADTG
jgi:hypothetical protein